MTGQQDVSFAVLDVVPEPYTVTPVLTAHIDVSAGGEDPVHAIALRCQVRIEPPRRFYSDEEAAGLIDLFGPRERWASTQRTFLWQHCTAMVPGFTGRTTVALPLDCTYDFEVAASKYLNALRDGVSPSNSCSVEPFSSSPNAGSRFSRCPGIARIATGCRSRSGET